MNEASGNTIFDSGPNSINIGINSASWSTESKPECNFYEYNWSNGQTTQSIEVSSSGSYTLQLINSSCSSQDDIDVFFEVNGCTDETACNYDIFSTCDDGYWEYANKNADCDGTCLDGYVLINEICVL